MKWAKSKIVVCFLIIIMLSVFSLGDLAASKALGRINTMIAVLSVFSSTPAYATNGSEPHPDYPDCSEELKAQLRAMGRVATGTAALIAAGKALAIAVGTGLWPLIVLAGIVLAAAKAFLIGAIVRLRRATQAYEDCLAGG